MQYAEKREIILKKKNKELQTWKTSQSCKKIKIKGEEE